MDYPGITVPDLMKGERVLWSGRPAQGVIFRPADFFLVPLSLLMVSFAIFWEFLAATGEDASVYFALWGVPFVVLGLYISVGRFVVDRLLRSKTTYAVTNERIMIVSGFPGQTVRARPLKTLGEIRLKQHRDDTGTILFEGAPRVAPWNIPNKGNEIVPAYVSFERIEHAEYVASIIRRAQKEMG